MQSLTTSIIPNMTIILISNFNHEQYLLFESWTISNILIPNNHAHLYDKYRPQKIPNILIQNNPEILWNKFSTLNILNILSRIIPNNPEYFIPKIPNNYRINRLRTIQKILIPNNIEIYFQILIPKYPEQVFMNNLNFDPVQSRIFYPI